MFAPVLDHLAVKGGGRVEGRGNGGTGLGDVEGGEELDVGEGEDGEIALDAAAAEPLDAFEEEKEEEKEDKEGRE